MESETSSGSFLRSKSAQDIQDALKDLLGGTIKEMMESEMDEHLGYRKSERPIAMTIAMAIKPNR